MTSTIRGNIDGNTCLILVAAFSLIMVYSTTIAFASVADSSNSGIKWYDKALSVNQNNVPALVEKGTDFVNQGNAAQGLTWLDKALNIDSNNIMALISKGTALRGLGEYQQAIALYDKVLTIDSNDIYAIGGKADSLYHSGKPQQAIVMIDKVLELNPTDGKVQQVKESLAQAIN